MTKPTVQLKQFKSSINELDEREKTVLLHRLQGTRANTLARIGKKLNLSGARVLQLEKSAWDRVVASSTSAGVTKTRKTKAKVKKVSAK